MDGLLSLLDVVLKRTLLRAFSIEVLFVGVEAEDSSEFLDLLGTAGASGDNACDATSEEEKSLREDDLLLRERTIRDCCSICSWTLRNVRVVIMNKRLFSPFIVL